MDVKDPFKFLDLRIVCKQAVAEATTASVYHAGNS